MWYSCVNPGDGWGEFVDVLPGTVSNSGDGVYFPLLSNYASGVVAIKFDGSIAFTAHGPIPSGAYVQANISLMMRQ